MLTSDVTKVNAVHAAYFRVIQRLFKKFARPKAPTQGKHFDNCMAFFESASEFDASLESLMVACLEHFPPYWCMSKFKRQYPQVQMLVAEKSRNRGLKSFPRKVAQGKPDLLPALYADQLKGFTPKEAQGLLNDGFLGGDVGLRDQVWEILEGRWDQ